MYTDKELIEQLKQDTGNGVKLIMEKYETLVRSVCANKLNNKEDIEECINDVFMEFCTNYEQYDGEKGTLKNYLCVIAERRAIDRFRKNRRMQKMEEEVVQKYQENQAASFNQMEHAERLNEAMKQLPPLEQKILQMHYYDGLKYTEIAEELDMNYENVKKRGLRGKKKLLYLLLLGILLITITACTAKIMKDQGILPSWFPFYDWIMSDEPEEEEDQDQHTKQRDGKERKESDKKNSEEEDAAEEILEEPERNSSVRRYYVTTQNGFVWSDKAAYEMIENKQVYQKEDITYYMEHIFYQDGKWEVEVCVSCSDMERVMANYVEGTHTPEEWVEIWNSQTESWNMQEMKYLSDSYMVLDNEKIDLALVGSYALPYEKVPDSYVFQFTGQGVPENEGEEQIKVSIVLPSERIFDVTLAKLEMKEVEIEEEENVGDINEGSDEVTDENIKEETGLLKLPGDVEIRRGISTLSNGMAIVGLSQENIGEYKISDMLTRNSFWYNAASRHPVLVDSEGNIYKHQRISRKDVETEEGIRSEFEIYFQGIEAGDYKLKIPQICLKKDMVTETIELSLPTGEEDTLACDLNVLFPDGTGFHITEIRRSEGIKNKYFCDDGVNWRLVEVHVWNYELLYEPVSVSEIQFVTARGIGTSSNGQSVNSQLKEDKEGNETYVFEVESEEMPETLSLKFMEPVYLLEQEIEFDITIQEE